MDKILHSEILHITQRLISNVNVTDNKYLQANENKWYL